MKIIWAFFFLPLIASQARNETDDFDPMNLNNETEFETMDNSTSTNKTTGVLDNLLAFLFTPLIGSATKNQTSENTTMINDEFDDFFDSIDDPEPPTLDFKLNNLASTIDLAHDLATELKNELTNNSNDDILEAEMLAVQLHDATQNLSSMFESKHLTILLQTASRILTSARTCQDLANLGITSSGTYQLDPDGPDSIAEPIMVLCDFTSNTTEIISDMKSEIKIEKCPENANGCHQTYLNYDAPMDQIRALIDASETCEQSIRFDCFLAPLMVFGYGHNGSDHMGFWRDWNGTQRTFFHGNLDPDQPHICQCGKLHSHGV